MEPRDRFIGCLIGTAVGDSLLLPAEGLSRKRIARRFAGPLHQRLVFGHGMVSDDTDHQFMTARALAAHRDDAIRFARRLGWRLRWWLACIPAGCGQATAKGIVRLMLGWSPERSGVASGGNGPSMRAAIIGAVHAHDSALRRAFVTASTSLTHRHPHALAAALAVAETAAWIVRGESIAELWPLLAHPDPEWSRVLTILRTWHDSGGTTDALAESLGCPQYVSGWSLQSIPFALGCWLRHRGDATSSMTAVLRAGGDTDTIGAIIGGLHGVDQGEAAFPPAWVGRIIDWPVSLSALRAAGAALAGAPTARWRWQFLPLRNFCFTGVVIVHIVRRLMP